MKTDLSVVRKYGNALFELSIDKNLLEVIYKDLNTFLDLLANDRDVKVFTFSFKVTPEEKASVFKQAFPDFHELTHNFLATVFANKRQIELEGIIREFQRLYKIDKNDLDVKITVPVGLDDSTAKSITSSLSDLTKQNVILDVNTDSSILGGMKLRIGNVVYDGSVSGRLSKLREKLIIEN